MQELSLEEKVEQVCRKDTRYHRHAYAHVIDSLDFTKTLASKEQRPESPRLKKKACGNSAHVTGQQLLEGIRGYTLCQYGPLAQTVLAEWGVNSCDDFGEIVFNLIEIGVLGKRESDTRADFSGGYDFEEAFVRPFLPKSKLPKERKKALTPGA